MSAEVGSVQDGLALAAVGRLCVAVWSGAVSRPLFELQAFALARVVERHPTQAGFLCIVETGAKPPHEELRRASADMIESHGEQLAFVAAVMNLRQQLRRAAVREA